MKLKNRLLLTYLLASFVAVICIYTLVRLTVNNSISKIQNSNTSNLLEIAMLSIENQYKSLEFHRTYSFNIRKNERRNVVAIAKTLISEYYFDYKNGKLSLGEAQKQALEKISNFQYDSGVGYIWINDTRKPIPKMLVHPVFPELNNQILSDPIFNSTKDSSNLFRVAADICLKNGGGFIEYLWPKPTGSLHLDEQPKTSYVELFEPWQWVIGTGIYLEDIEKDVQSRMDALILELKQTIGEIQIADSGYFYIFNSKKEMLLHPFLIGHQGDSILNPDTQQILFEDIIDAYNYSDKNFNYYWRIPNIDKETYVLKKVYIDYFEPLDWYVCASIYPNEFKQPAISLGRNILLISTVFLLLLILVTIRISNSVVKPLDNLMLFVSKLQSNFGATDPSQIPVSGTYETRSLAIVIKELLTSINEKTKALIQAKAKAEESDNLKTSFLANMSHEIRTPLNAIVGFSSLIESETNAEKRKEFINAISNSSDDLLSLIDDIIDISSIESNNLKINKKIFDVNEMLYELSDIIHALLFRTCKHDAINHKLVTIENKKLLNSDADRIKQIFTNLLSNAIKFTEEGEIEYGYKIIENSPINKYKTGELQFYVKDTGIGIPLEIQNSIFDRFFKSNESKVRLFRGTGLGLAISKSLVELLGGEFSLESEEGKGSTFFFTIPNDLELGEQIPANLKPQGIKATLTHDWSGKRILIAEDEDLNYLFLKEVLRKTNADLKRVYNGLEAVQLFNKESFDLILMDIRMPVMSGLEAVRQIRETNSNIPIIAITAYGMADDEAKCISTGCDAYLSKPFKPSDFFTIAGNIFG